MSESWRPALFGYASQFSVAPGDSISFHISGEDVERYTARLVRLRHGLDRPDGPGFRESEIASTIDGEYPAVHQPDNSGSYVEVPDPEGLLSRSSSLSVSLDLFPTSPDGRLQGVLGTWDADRSSGYAVVVEDGRLALWVGDGNQQARVAVEEPLQSHTWYRVRAAFDLQREHAWIEQTPARSRAGSRSAVRKSRGVPGARRRTVGSKALVVDAPFRMGALSRRRDDAWAACAHFSGKLGNPSLRAGGGAGTTLASWDFAVSNRSDRALLRHVADTSPSALHGVCVNTPTRGVTGADWDGAADDYRLNPESYGAIHFHEDDLDDSAWPAAFELVIPGDLRSGVYAIRLRGEGVEEHIPFFVRPGAADPRSPVLC